MPSEKQSEMYQELEMLRALTERPEGLYPSDINEGQHRRYIKALRLMTDRLEVWICHLDRD